MREREEFFAALGKAPKLPRLCPVTALHLRTDNDRNGNPRRCYVVVQNATGYVVEVLEDDGTGEAVLYRRWPWFAGYFPNRDGFGLPATTGPFALTLDVAPAEWRSWLKRTPVEDAECHRLRVRANRCEVFSRMLEVTAELAANGKRWIPNWDREGARAMRRLMRAGLAACEDGNAGAVLFVRLDDEAEREATRSRMASSGFRGGGE